MTGRGYINLSEGLLSSMEATPIPATWTDSVLVAIASKVYSGTPGLKINGSPEILLPCKCDLTQNDDC